MTIRVSERFAVSYNKHFLLFFVLFFVSFCFFGVHLELEEVEKCWWNSEIPQCTHVLAPWRL